MIPKKIHYCWFGHGEKPKLAQKCIASWREYCPSYEIVEWNEDNFNTQAHPYAAYCYEQKKWAFLSDYVRLVVIEQYGGIYFDTDVELLRSPDFLLENEAFYGFENDSHVNTGQGFGSQAHHPTLLAMLDQYRQLEMDKDGKYPIIGCPILNTQALLGYGLKLNGKQQNVGGAEVFPTEYFNPYESATGRLNRTKRTVSVHWYSGSWMDKKTALRGKLTKPFHRLFGEKCFRWLKR